MAGTLAGDGTHDVFQVFLTDRLRKGVGFCTSSPYRRHGLPFSSGFLFPKEFVLKESDILELAKAIEERRGKISVFLGGSMFNLSPEYLVSFLTKTEQAFTAELYGVSMQKVIQWEEHFKDRQCRAKTTTGRRCRNDHDTSYSLDTFDNSIHRFCRIHGGRP